MPSSVNLQFCKKNLELYSQSVYAALRENYPELKIEVKDCVDMCGMCTDVPFAMRNGALIGARDPMGLYRKLERGMNFMTAQPLPGTSGYQEQLHEKEPAMTTIGTEQNK